MSNTDNKKLRFEYEFEDQSSKSQISYECDEDEKISVALENGIPVIYANRKAYVLLAKICAKLGLSDYRDGFHIHLNGDFDEDKQEAVRFVLDNE